MIHFRCKITQQAFTNSKGLVKNSSKSKQQIDSKLFSPNSAKCLLQLHFYMNHFTSFTLLYFKYLYSISSLDGVFESAFQENELKQWKGNELCIHSLLLNLFESRPVETHGGFLNHRASAGWLPKAVTSHVTQVPQKI